MSFFKRNETKKSLNYKKCKFIVKSVKKHTGNTFRKKLVPVSKDLIKEKSNCTICLTESTFIHEIEDKYDLESKVKVFPKFFTGRCYKGKWRLTV